MYYTCSVLESLVISNNQGTIMSDQPDEIRICISYPCDLGQHSPTCSNLLRLIPTLLCDNGTRRFAERVASILRKRDLHMCPWPERDRISTRIPYLPLRVHTLASVVSTARDKELDHANHVSKLYQVQDQHLIQNRDKHHCSSTRFGLGCATRTLNRHVWHQRDFVKSVAQTRTTCSRSNFAK